jgi:hypothetical protein
LSSGTEEATYFMERTFYRADGSQIPDEEVNADVTQEMVRDDEEWKLVMRRDLVEDILSAEGPTTVLLPGDQRCRFFSISRSFLKISPLCAGGAAPLFLRW